MNNKKGRLALGCVLALALCSATRAAEWVQTWGAAPLPPTAALGCKDSDGTHDGEFRPHMTLGQSGLNDKAIDYLTRKAGRTVGLTFDAKSLAVLKRTGLNSASTTLKSSSVCLASSMRSTMKRTR